MCRSSRKRSLAVSTWPPCKTSPWAQPLTSTPVHSAKPLQGLLAKQRGPFGSLRPSPQSYQLREGPARGALLSVVWKTLEDALAGRRNSCIKGRDPMTNSERRPFHPHCDASARTSSLAHYSLPWKELGAVPLACMAWLHQSCTRCCQPIYCSPAHSPAAPPWQQVVHAT